ncbi:NlpC/P60 family protein [Asanoa sp. WMMD1127]|uniref:C40 family peptidase n=1 Tax=Asanoa sp. WMMD1127 TaxID=3016107 RepID=UPI002416D349|nr:C40 family peptidase [Asanoa sp. WMMD1127]MDG4820383.1 NlpC/P60 family protein [Asanoa sp. WMMD1127]
MSSARMSLRALVLVAMAVVVAVPAGAASAEPSASELTAKINKSSAELEKVVEAYNKLNEETKATKKQAGQVADRLGPLQQQLDAAQADVGDIAVAAYQTGRLGPASALLAGGDDMLDRMAALDSLARERQTQIDAFRSTREQLTSDQQRLATARAQQDAQAKELQARKKKIENDLDKLYDLRRQAYGSSTSSGSSYSGKIPSVSGKAGVAVRYAYNAIGTPYVWAAEGPNGYDCSGLTLAAWRAAGKTLPHNAAMQWDKVAHISRSQLAAGDLVFYSGLGHVALYVGGGQVIHAPTFGESVKLASVDMMSPYGYGRVR